MIQVTRSAKPTVLAKNEGKWLQALKTASTDDARKLAANKYRHKEVLHTLKAMFHSKCAYCESCIGHVSYPQIEHFQPKDGPNGDANLTFAWENLLLACGVCNGPSYKGIQFPNTADGGPLINPCVDNPDDHFNFAYDPVLKLADVIGKTLRGQTTERILGLNRRELRAYRSRQVTRMAAIATMAPSDSEAARLLQEAKRADADYSRFTRDL